MLSDHLESLEKLAESVQVLTFDDVKDSSRGQLSDPTEIDVSGPIGVEILIGDCIESPTRFEALILYS
jgi:hypothetical protein